MISGLIQPSVSLKYFICFFLPLNKLFLLRVAIARSEKCVRKNVTLQRTPSFELPRDGWMSNCVSDFFNWTWTWGNIAPYFQDLSNIYMVRCTRWKWKETVVWFAYQRWPESHFKTPLLSQYFLNRMRLRNFQIWESHSSSKSGNHRCNRNSVMFVIKQWRLQRPSRLDPDTAENKVSTDPGLLFHKFLTPRPKKRRIRPESTSDLWPPLLTDLVFTQASALLTPRLRSRRQNIRPFPNFRLPTP